MINNMMNTAPNISDIPIFYGKYNTYSPSEAGPSIQIIKSDTESVQAFEESEPEIIPFDLTRLSGSLDFWNNPEEDIYNLEDGQPI